MTTIADQRRVALKARRALSPTDRLIASRRACRRLAYLPVVRRARRIGLYQPLASEIDPTRLIDGLDPATEIYFPRVEDDRLRFVLAPRRRGAAAWRTSALGIAEPRGRSRSVAALDVLVVPLAGFDARAHRIGLGGGFYDRTLALLRDAPYRSPTRIGLAFDIQRLDAIIPESWDIPLDAVATERAVYRPAGVND